MELTPCPHCATLLFTGSRTCPHCAQPLATEPTARPLSMILLGLMLGGCGEKDEDTGAPSDTADSTVGALYGVPATTPAPEDP